jgi:DNA repair ATPase RecN
MKVNLDRLKDEIQQYLESRNFVVFHSQSRSAEAATAVQWDSRLYPDFKAFLEVCRQLEVRLVCFHHRELSPDFIDDVMDDLETADIPRDEYQRLEERLRELRIYEGLTSVVELSFNYQNLTYIYSQRASWYDELMEIADEIDDYLAVENEEEGNGESMGGYFSRN